MEHLLLATSSIGLVRKDVEAAQTVLGEALRRHAGKTPGLSDVVALDVLRVKVVLHYVSIPVPVLAAILHLIPLLERPLPTFADLMTQYVIVRRLSRVIGWWNQGFQAHVEFNFPGVVASPRTFFVARVGELLR